MLRPLIPATLLACTILLSGCDTVNSAINDALPEISVGDGVLGLNGETGVEISGDFAASKTGDAQATARFALSQSFDDLDTGDIQKLTALSTSLVLAASDGSLITVNRGSASSIPDAITISGGSVTVSISDANSSFSMPLTSFGSLGTLVKLPGCIQTGNLATSCAFSSGNAAPVLASYSLNATQASSVLAIVAESTPPTPNSVSITVDLNVSGNELAGTSATIRVGEYETTVQAEIF